MRIFKEFKNDQRNIILKCFSLLKLNQNIKLPIFSESTRRADFKNIYIVKKIFLNRPSGLGGQIRNFSLAKFYFVFGLNRVFLFEFE